MPGRSSYPLRLSHTIFVPFICLIVIILIGVNCCLCLDFPSAALWEKKQKHDGSKKVFIFVLRQRSIIKIVILEAGFIILYEHTKFRVLSNWKKNAGN